MKAAVILCVVICASVAVAMPPPGGMFGGAGASPFMPAIAQAFIPSPADIAALNALHTTPAPGVAPAAAPAGPTPPPTMPPAVANLVSKYMKAAAAYAPPSTGILA